jgi:hypothetical protein
MDLDICGNLFSIRGNLTMLFRKSDHRKKNNPLTTFFRLILSLFIMLILGIGLLQAYKAFSGYDPTSLSPAATLKSLLTSEGLYKFINDLLTFNPQAGLSGAKSVLEDGVTDTDTKRPQAPVLYKFAIIADPHKDYEGLGRAISQAKENGAKFLIAMGDLSDVGTVDELRKTKEQYDLSGLPYYATLGDHDMWDSRDKKNDPNKNFQEVFGSPYQAFTYSNTRFILINNADNYLGVDALQLSWIEDELKKEEKNPSDLLFVIADIPLFHPSSDHVMGKVSDKLRAQAEHLNSIFARHGVDEVISADVHMYSEYIEPTNNLEMTTAGAVTSEKNPQSPRFLMVDVHQDGGYNIQDTEVK